MLAFKTTDHVRAHRRGKYEGPEAERLATLKWAAMLGAAYVDVELEAAKFFFGGAESAHHSLYVDRPCFSAEAMLLCLDQDLERGSELHEQPLGP